jgi:hypothetical protein
MWTSLFHTERPLIKAPKTTKTTVSKVEVHYPPVETRALPIEFPQSAVPQSASSMQPSKETLSMESIIVKKGQSIIRLEQQYYGRSNITLADLILDFNPDITNENLISANQKIRIPKITERSLIVQSSDRKYKINVGTFWSSEFANIYRSEPSLRGKEIEIVVRKVAPKKTWYRVVVGKFDSEEEVLKEIAILKDKKLLPLFAVNPI